MMRHTQTTISSEACISHTFCLLLLLSSFFFAYVYALSLFVGIHRQRVMTREERGEDVYGCMLGQTLNDERNKKSNPINSAKRKKKDGDTVMILFMSQEKLTKS
jgi:hypothetical protein